MTDFKPRGPLPLYMDDFKRSTLGWSAEERFCYLSLLAAMWAAGGFVEDDDAVLADAMGVNRARKWREKVEKVRCKLVSHADKPGFLTQPRLLRDIEKAAEVSQKRAVAGAKGGSKSPSKEEAKAKQLQPSPTPSPSPSISHPSDAQVAEATGRGGYTDEFKRFWQAYPTRTPNPKKPAFAAWVAAKRHGADPETMIRGAQGYARWTRQRANEDANWGDHLIAQAQTFLRQARWEEFADARAGPDAGRPRTMEEIRRARSQAWN